MRTLLIVLALCATAEAGPRKVGKVEFKRQLRIEKAKANSYPVRDVLVSAMPGIGVLRILIGCF